MTSDAAFRQLLFFLKPTLKFDTDYTNSLMYVIFKDGGSYVDLEM
jgi:hypothetical protein